MKIVFNAGIYDCTHHGHVELFEMMRELGDLVFAVIHDDESCYQIKGKIPIQSLQQRIHNLLITGLVDGILITKETDPAPEFERLAKRFDDLIYVRGDDLTDDFPGRWMLDKHKVPIVFKPYTKGISSTEIRDSL